MGKRKYKRLHYEDRQTIEAMSKQGSSVSDIAEALGTHRDTIYREFKRCNATLKTYTAEPAKIVHHKRWLNRDNINDTDITLNWDNLEALCQDCHNKEHHKSAPRLRYRFDADGGIIPPMQKRN